MEKLFKLGKDFKIHMIERAWDVESIMVPFGLFGLFSLPFFYFLNLYVLYSSPQIPLDYRNGNIVLRIVCSSFCLALAFKSYWPTILRPYLPLVWYSAVFLFMPFFAIFMILQNHFSATWVLNSISILILTMLLVDWIAYAFLLILAILLGTFAYYLTSPHISLFSINTEPLTFTDILITYVISIIMGVVFNQRKGVIEKAKLQTAKAIGTSIAHELRTPLASIQAGIIGAKIYFPVLLDSYMFAKENNATLSDIPSDHFETLLTLFDELEEETKYSNTIIDMLLIKSKKRGFNKAAFSVCSINHCIDEAIRRYPFKEGELKLITWDNQEDFNFRGESLLVLHVFFNLIKNALYFIEQEGKGSIKIWYENSLQYNLVHFKDTAKGIPNHVMLKLFERFYSYSNRGTGLGLAFCKMVMQGLKGDIRCQSTYGEFTDFILYFPKSIEN